MTEASDKRSAHATVKGFLAQAVRTVELWLDLEANEELHCERLEDADVENDVEVVCRQFKELSSPVSEMTLRDVIANFAEGFAVSGEKSRRFVLVTTAALRPNNPLLRDWTSLSASSVETQLKQLFSSPSTDHKQAHRFMTAAEVISKRNDGWTEFQKAVTWSFDVESFEQVEFKLIQRLSRDFGQLADCAMSQLLRRVLVASARQHPADRTLTRTDAEDVLRKLEDGIRSSRLFKLLKDIEREPYEKELALGRRTISDHISRHQHHVDRPDLIERLQRALNAGPVLVHGDRGVGKTELVARAVGQLPVCWLDTANIGGTPREMERVFEVLRCLGADQGVLVVDGAEMATAQQLEQLSTLVRIRGGARVVVVSRLNNGELNRAIPDAIPIEVGRLTDDEIDQLVRSCGAVDTRSELWKAPFFFWLARGLKPGTSYATEREVLEAHWSRYELSGNERGVLAHIAGQCLEQCRRDVVFQQCDETDQLVRKRFLEPSQRNSRHVHFQHDILLDFAIAYEVLQTKTAGELTTWLTNVDVLTRSWCLPAIAFEAARQFDNDRESYWHVACAVPDSVQQTWRAAAPISGAPKEHFEELRNRLKASRPTTVFFRVCRQSRDDVAHCLLAAAIDRAIQDNDDQEFARLGCVLRERYPFRDRASVKAPAGDLVSTIIDGAIARRTLHELAWAICWAVSEVQAGDDLAAVLARIDSGLSGSTALDGLMSHAQSIASANTESLEWLVDKATTSKHWHALKGTVHLLGLDRRGISLASRIMEGAVRFADKHCYRGELHIAGHRAFVAVGREDHESDSTTYANAFVKSPELLPLLEGLSFPASFWLTLARCAGEDHELREHVWELAASPGLHLADVRYHAGRFAEQVLVGGCPARSQA